LQLIRTSHFPFDSKKIQNNIHYVQLCTSRGVSTESTRQNSNIRHHHHQQEATSWQQQTSQRTATIEPFSPKRKTAHHHTMQRYIIHEEIGKGSFGTVFRATTKDDAQPQVRMLNGIADLFFSASFPPLKLVYTASD
jgi:hypothetical protein